VDRSRAQPESNPFALDLSFEHPAARAAWALARPWIERMTGMAEIGDAYRRVDDKSTVDAFVEGALRELGIDWHANELDLARVPRSGGCIVVANHPFGAAEGLVLARMLRGARNDVLILANHLLERVPPMRHALLSIDPFGRRDAAVSNSGALRRAVRFVRDGGMLALFPSGEVAHFDWRRGRVIEAPWHETLAHLVRASKAPVLPVHFRGHNGPFFQAAGLVHPRLRTALLGRELVNKRGKRIEARVGAIVSQKKLASLGEPARVVAYLRERTAMLGERNEPKPVVLGWRPNGAASLREANAKPIALPVDAAQMGDEIRALPQDQVLVRENGRLVCWARAHQIPLTLGEIGRLREVTFRAVHEGTGRAIDLDAFDRTYLHLFVFDEAESAIVGAYRLGPTDELLARGPRGLYTSTLFDMKPELFRRMGPALEMGRSFVCARYQRSASGLFLLWRGIGQFIARFPRYRVLFGPVSISQAYTQASRELMVDFIRVGEHMHPLDKFVRPRHPFSRRPGFSVDSGLPVARFLEDIEEVSGLVADIEPDQKGVPILLKQYLRLGGKMLGFNVDPKFSGVLDGLVLVDLLDTDAKTLSRYLGAEQAAAFLAHHRAEPSPAHHRVTAV
jgi:putative hemolysin